MKDIIDSIIRSLKDINGLEAIVLGGSRAKGTHSPDSDIDIGLYYDKETIDLPLLEKRAQELDQDHRENLLSKPGEWGKWVNGGCWITIGNIPVDFILRDVSRVKKAIEECREGIVSPHYQTGHPHAYFNAMYMGELAICKMLWNQDDEILRLKALAEEYPQKLKKELIRFFSFEAGFSQMLAEKSIAGDDVYYVSAHLVRSISALNQILFALNEQYCINEKKAVKMIDGFSISPNHYKEKVDAIFSLSGTDLFGAYDHLKRLINEVDLLL
jgi:predicted nucleotidyltransferase